MPRRDDIEKILLIGSGPIVIGQAAEFDYSGVQACKVLLEEGYEVVLVNSNPATIMTDPEFATATYIEPLLPGPGDQDHRKGAPRRAAADARRPDRAQPGDGPARGRHAGALRGRADRRRRGRDPPRRGPRGVPHDDDRGRPADPLVDDGREPRRGRGGARRRAASPCRRSSGPAFTMGGQGGGVGETETELRQVVSEGLAASPINQVLVEESVIGWGEFELEVMRDRNDNVVIICSIENVDPMGVHTGDSVTVAPAQTLTDPLYQDLRDQAIKVIRGDRGRDRRLQRPVRGQSRERRDRRDRDEPAGLALLGAGLEGDRLPDREDGGEAGGRLRAGGDPQRHHPRHAGLLRADDRLRRHQDPALRLREVPRRRGPALDLHAERRRGDGDRPHLPRVLRQGDALARARLRGRAPASRRGAARARSRCPAPSASTWSSRPSAAGIDVEAVHERCLVDRWFLRELRGARHARATAPRAWPAPTRRSTPAPPSSRRRRPTTTPRHERPRPTARRRPPRSAAASATRSSSSAPARTGSARGSSSTTAACTRR